MYDKVIELIKSMLPDLPFYYNLDDIYVVLLFTKYLGDNKKNGFSITKIKKSENLNEVLDYLKKEFKIFYNSKLRDKELNKILNFMEDYSLKSLIEEFLEKKRDNGNEILELFKKDNDNILYLNMEAKYEYYNSRNEKATYVEEGLDESSIGFFSYFKLLDIMLSLKRKYVKSINNVNFEDYDLIILHNDSYFGGNDRKFFENFTMVFHRTHKPETRFVIKAPFQTASKFHSPYIIKRSLNRVLFYNSKEQCTMFIEFKASDDENVSMIWIEKTGENDLDRIKGILESGRAKKNVLIKVPRKDIVENNCHLVFKLYQSEYKEKIKRINDIVDDNEKLMNRLERLNKDITEEVNKLIVKNL